MIFIYWIIEYVRFIIMAIYREIRVFEYNQRLQSKEFSSGIYTFLCMNPPGLDAKKIYHVHLIMSIWAWYAPRCKGAAPCPLLPIHGPPWCITLLTKHNTDVSRINGDREAIGLVRVVHLRSPLPWWIYLYYIKTKFEEILLDEARVNLLNSYV